VATARTVVLFCHCLSLVPEVSPSTGQDAFSGVFVLGSPVKQVRGRYGSSMSCLGLALGALMFLVPPPGQPTLFWGACGPNVGVQVNGPFGISSLTGLQTSAATLQTLCVCGWPDIHPDRVHASLPTGLTALSRLHLRLTWSKLQWGVVSLNALGLTMPLQFDDPRQEWPELAIMWTR
jgi:hypothetical protein